MMNEHECGHEWERERIDHEPHETTITYRCVKCDEQAFTTESREIEE